MGFDQVRSGSSLRCIDDECISNDLDARVILADHDGHDVEAACGSLNRLAGQVCGGHAGNATLFPSRHGLGRIAACFLTACLDLDEHQTVTVPGNDVDFAEAGAIATGKDCVPFAHERANRQIFSTFADDEMCCSRHALARCKRGSIAIAGANHPA
jgi:hypothetical protein